MATLEPVYGSRRGSDVISLAYSRVTEIHHPPRIDSLESLEVDSEVAESHAQTRHDGRFDLSIFHKKENLGHSLRNALSRQITYHEQEQEQLTLKELDVDPLEVYKNVPKLNIVIQIVGSRGDVQPFIALGQVLIKAPYNHRVRICTHPVFKEFVEESGLEFFSIGGDPAVLMAYMVKNPGLFPGIKTMRGGEISRRRQDVATNLESAWRSCIEPVDGAFDREDGVPSTGPFIADAIIANPPSFAHLHCAEKLGIPLHLMFTMPWSPTQSFPHPLANLKATNVDTPVYNFLSYGLVELMTQEGLGDVINDFRVLTLGLSPISNLWAGGLITRLQVPYTYCWSTALIPKPKDWASHITISGFFFLGLASQYTPPPELADFLAAGPPPVYIGFGSIVVDNPDAMTAMIFEAVKKAGVRAIISKGWGGLGVGESPEGVLLLGNCPHDWLFSRVSCVVHHGGAGTTAIGIAMGKPTVVVPFFGDQPFWGAMIARAGAGPTPTPFKDTTADSLAENINFALKPETVKAAEKMAQQIEHEDGKVTGAQQFHQALDLDVMRCQICPNRLANWMHKKSKLKLSAMAATTLVKEGIIKFNDLELLRHKEWLIDQGPQGPITGSLSAVIGTLANVLLGVGILSVDLAEATRRAPNHLPRAFTHKKADPTSPEAIEDTTASDEREIEHILTTLSTNGPAAKKRSQSWLKRKHRSSRLKKKNNLKIHSAMNGSLGHDIRHDLGRTGLAFASILMIPVELTYNIALGCHNMPFTLWNDETVRKATVITGIKSGCIAVGKEFTFGLYDGITGLVTQPYRGAKKEGGKGFAKGVGKGVGGLFFKGSAAIWGIPGYSLHGIYQQFCRLRKPETVRFLAMNRAIQGLKEWNLSSVTEQRAVLDKWFQIENKRKHTE